MMKLACLRSYFYKTTMQLFLLVFGVFISIISRSFAQDKSVSLGKQNLPVDIVRKITVTGYAEMEIVPNQIYISLALREYAYADTLKDSLNKIVEIKKIKVEIDSLEEQLQRAAFAVGVAPEDFNLENISSYNPWWNYHIKPMDFFVHRQYRLKLTALDKLNNLLVGVDRKSIESLYIETYTHSDIEDFKKELKIKAIQAAKQKAVYLLEAIGEQCGGAVDIQEMNDDNMPQGRMLRTLYATQSINTANTNDDVELPPISFKKIKLTSQVQAVFEIE